MLGKGFPRFFFSGLLAVLALAAHAEGPAGRGELASVAGPAAITHARPAWMNGGIVMAGNWASLIQRRHRIDASWTQTGYGLTDAQAEEAYRKEMSPEMADRLKEKGVTFVMLPLWSGHGTYEQEFPGMEDTKRFAELVHARGMRVGVYIHQGMLSRAVLTAIPQAYDWLAWPSLESSYTTPPPPETESEGYPVYRNHPDYQQYMRRCIDYAINEVKADLLHFDNYVYTSGWSPWAVDDFRAYLRAKFTPVQLEAHFGGADLKDIGQLAYAKTPPASLEWLHFQAWVYAESFRKLAEYARSLKPDVATEVNADSIKVGFRQPVDLSQLVPHGDAFWAEHVELGWDPDKPLLNSGIRSYKVARLFHQSAFTYTATSRLRTCEALAFNYDCLGCDYWFMYGRLNWAVTTDSPADDRLMPETRFYLDNRDLFNQGETLADVAVLRGRSVNIYGHDIHSSMAMPPEWTYKKGTGWMGWSKREWEDALGPDDPISSAYLFEQGMITEHVPFEIIFDQHLSDLSKYRAVALPDVRMMNDDQIEKLVNYVEDGGGLVITGQTATQDNWGRPRPNGLGRFLSESEVPAEPGANVIETRGRGRVVYTWIQRPKKFSAGSLPRNGGQLAQAVAEAMGGAPTFRTDAPPYVAMEFIQQANRILVNLLDIAQEAGDKPIQIGVSSALGAVSRARLLSPRRQTAQLEVKSPNGGSEVTLPGLDVYTVLVLDFE